MSQLRLKENSRFGLHGIPIEDFRAYPVVFLYRHALVLYQKTVLLIGSPMLSINGQPEINPQTLRTTQGLDLLRHELQRIFEGLRLGMGSRYSPFSYACGVPRCSQRSRA